MARAGAERFGRRLVSAAPQAIEPSAVSRQAAVSPVVELTDSDGRVWASEYEAAGRRCLDVPGVATFIQGSAPGAIGIVRAPEATDAVIEETLARGVAAVFAHRSGLEILHASAAELAGKVAAFCGAPHSGKSTLAYALAGRGHRQWSDDLLAIDADAGPARIVPLPFVPRLRDPSATFFALAQTDAPADLPGLVAESQELGVLFLIERRPEAEVRVEQVGGADSFIQALGSSLFLEDAEGERRDLTIKHFLALAAEVPLFRLEFPSDLGLLDEVLDLVEDVVAQTAST